MRIPNQLLREWEKLRSGGDAIKIAELANVSPMTIYRAFRDEVCNDKVLDVIAKYYKEKKAKIDNLISDFQD
jgi:AcrR family transcriptional regulator